MKHIPIGNLLIIVLILTGFGNNVLAKVEHPAEVLVKNTIDKTMARLKQDEALIKENTKHMHMLVNEMVLPHFDFTKMSTWALGKYNRKANSQQKQEFSEQFKLLLVRTYSKALVEALGRTIVYLPSRINNKKPDEITVRTEVEQGSALPLPINYKMHKLDNDWKVYDVSIDGISIVSNYRNSFAKEIRQSGIDKLIARLAARNNESD